MFFGWFHIQFQKFRCLTFDGKTLHSKTWAVIVIPIWEVFHMICLFAHLFIFCSFLVCEQLGNRVLACLGPHPYHQRIRMSVKETRKTNHICCSSCFHCWLKFLFGVLSPFGGLASPHVFSHRHLPFAASRCRVRWYFSNSYSSYMLQFRRKIFNVEQIMLISVGFLVSNSVFPEICETPIHWPWYRFSSRKWHFEHWILGLNFSSKPATHPGNPKSARGECAELSGHGMTIPLDW